MRSASGIAEPAKSFRDYRTRRSSGRPRSRPTANIWFPAEGQSQCLAGRHPAESPSSIRWEATTCKASRSLPAAGMSQPFPRRRARTFRYSGCPPRLRGSNVMAFPNHDRLARRPSFDNLSPYRWFWKFFDFGTREIVSHYMKIDGAAFVSSEGRIALRANPFSFAERANRTDPGVSERDPVTPWSHSMFFLPIELKQTVPKGPIPVANALVIAANVLMYLLARVDRGYGRNCRRDFIRGRWPSFCMGFPTSICGTSF